ncbi:MAG: hypothetical protein ACI82G_002841, partial [Bradymonadia bacterium]
RTIVRTRDPRQLASPVSRYLFADRLEEPPAKLDKDDSSVRRQVPDSEAAPGAAEG